MQEPSPPPFLISHCLVQQKSYVILDLGLLLKTRLFYDHRLQWAEYRLCLIIIAYLCNFVQTYFKDFEIVQPPTFIDVAEKAVTMGKAEEGQPSAC